MGMMTRITTLAGALAATAASMLVTAQATPAGIAIDDRREP